MKEWIWLDMDGSLNFFYQVDGWLNDLQNFNPRPYVEAQPKYSPDVLNPILHKLKQNGYKIGIISWLSKESNNDYDEKVIKAKKNWLTKYQLTEVLDEIIITPYGVKKSDTCAKFGPGILVDDEEKNRKDWYLGYTINAEENIIRALMALI